MKPHSPERVPQAVAQLTKTALGTTLDASQARVGAVRCHVGAPISGGRILSTASITGGCRSQRFGPLLETE
jgi:hypothetical protein